jgi:3-oxoacyl-[acyl-carrier-protein] synthase-3
MKQNVYVTNTAAFLPNEPVSNDSMEKMLGLIGGKPSRARPLVLRNNGIKQRYYAIDPESGKQSHNNAQMTARAVEALTSSEFTTRQIDCLSCGTSSPDQLMPGHGVMVHGELGSPPCEVHSSSGICTSGIASLKYADLSVRSGDAKNAVATGSEHSTSFMLAKNFNPESEKRVRDLEKNPQIAFEKDFLRWMLSDGAGALLLQPQPSTAGLSLRIDWIELLSFAGSHPVCMYGGAELREDGSLKGWREYDSMNEVLEQSVLAVKQNVKLLNENVVRITVEQALPEILAKHALTSAQVDHFLPHMSSEYFRPRLAQGLKNIGFEIPQERWFSNLETVGNIGAASIYTMIDEIFHSGRLQPGQRLLCFVPESGRFSSSFMQLSVV